MRSRPREGPRELRREERLDAIERGAEPCRERLETQQLCVERLHVDRELPLDALVVLLELDAQLREMVFEGASLDAVRSAALASGRLRPLVADGARKVARGDTTTTEVVRVTRLAASLEAQAENLA